MIKIGIRSKLVLITLTAILVAGGISGYLNLKDIGSDFELSVHSLVMAFGETLSLLVQDEFDEGMHPPDMWSVTHACRNMMKANRYFKYCYMVDNGGKVILHNLEGEVGITYQDDVTRAAIGMKTPSFGVRSLPDDKKIYDYVFPVHSGDGLRIATIRLGVNTNILKAQMLAIIIRSIFFAVPFFIILIVSIMILTNIGILTPIRKLMGGLERIGRGESVSRIDVNSHDEIGTLANAFNDMAENLQKVSTSRDALNMEIIERQRLEEELRSSEEQYRLLAENLHDVIWTMGMDHKFSYISPAVKGVFGYTAQEALNLDYSQLMNEDSLKKFEKLLTAQPRQRQAQTLKFLRKDGTEFWGEVAVSYLYDDKKVPVGYIGTIRDIHEKKEAEDRLEITFQDLAHNERIVREIAADLQKKNKELVDAQNQLIQSGKMVAIGQLAVGIAHEIKNPLGIIQLGVETLDRRLKKLGDEKCEQVQMIRSAIERADKIIVQLLNFSRYSEKDFREVTLDSILEGAMNLILSQAESKGVKVKKNYKDDDSVRVVADSIMLEQVFFNILGNALDSVSPKGTISIKRSKRKRTKGRIKYYVTEITDTGEGMPEEVASRIFDPFFTTKGPGRGTGLGLSTSYMILEKHQGLVSVESKLGKGTKFIIMLPGSKDFKKDVIEV